MAPSIVEFPLELLDSVLEHLRPWDLLSAALTCKRFASSAVPLLWRDITIAFNIGGSRNGSIAAITGGPTLTGESFIYYRYREVDSYSWLRYTRTLKLIGPTDTPYLNFSGRAQLPQDLLDQVDRILVMAPAIDSLATCLNFFYVANTFSATLKTLELDLVGQIVTSEGMYVVEKLPILPLVVCLKIVWHDQDFTVDDNTEHYPCCLSVICQYMNSVPRLQFLSIRVEFELLPMLPESQFPGPICPLWMEDVRQVLFSTVVPDLERLDLALRTSFLDALVELTDFSDMGENSPHVVDVFSNFINRHRESIQHLSWVVIDDKYANQGDDECWERLKPPALPNLKSFSVESAIQRVTENCLRQLGDARSGVAKLRFLGNDTRHHFAFGLKWFRALLTPFTSLTSLELETGRAKLTDDTSTKYPRIEFFDDRAMIEFITLLPPTLEKIHLLFAVFGVLEMNSLNYLKIESKAWFEHLRGLQSVELDFLPLPFSTPKGGLHKLIFRRRPKSPYLPTAWKKVCIWHLESSHRETREQHGVPSNYCEIPLEGEFEGRDGHRWNFVDALSQITARKVRSCPHGCGKWLSGDGFSELRAV
ncbi:hypothetical protein ABW19_dt0202208 [Dactylella cylindrospora]|nr:hypothetical protein ABW19_dt0202208 [Dactylella cylindrospora]